MSATEVTARHAKNWSSTANIFQHLAADPTRIVARHRLLELVLMQRLVSANCRLVDERRQGVHALRMAQRKLGLIEQQSATHR